ncbi:MAG: flagellar motor protein MotB [Pseudomonadota bacterium]
MSEKDNISEDIQPVEQLDTSKIGMQGGAWKVAYADFVTAMMAFFLLMWLLNSTTEEQRAGIADYFDPKVPISQSSSGGLGMFQGDSVFAQKKLARNGLGGAGKKASAGRDDEQKHEVSSNEDVWRRGEAKNVNSGNSKASEAELEDSKDEAGALKEASEGGLDAEARKIEDDIRNQIERIAPNEGLAKQLNFKMTDEGLRIDITDDGDVQMFGSGSDKPTDKMQKIMSVVGTVVASLDNEIAITGHTDSKPFKSRRNYSNWELSSDRAHAARRFLYGTGVETDRIKRVEGRAAKEPLKVSDPEAAINRRIGIVLLRDTSEEAMRREHNKNSRREEENLYFEQDDVVQDGGRSIGTEGASQQDMFVPPISSFR